MSFMYKLLSPKLHSYSLRAGSLRISRRLFSQKETGQRPEVKLDPPIPYTTSPASTHTARSTHAGQMHSEVPWFQPFVVVGSVAAILIYFCVLREENDMDEEIGKSLWERIPGLEKQQLEVVLKYNEERGLDTKEIRKRLEEVKSKK